MEVFLSASQAETIEIGRTLGKRLKPPCHVLLSGELGSGKTTLVRGLVQGLGVRDPSVVRSPTFTLVNEYPAPGFAVYHVDLYRLDGWREQHSTGLEEILAGPSVVIVEWGEKLVFPLDEAVKIRLLADGDSRRLEVESLPLPS